MLGNTELTVGRPGQRCQAHNLRIDSSLLHTVRLHVQLCSFSPPSVLKIGTFHSSLSPSHIHTIFLFSLEKKIRSSSNTGSTGGSHEVAAHFREDIRSVCPSPHHSLLSAHHKFILPPLPEKAFRFEALVQIHEPSCSTWF